jgi:hypothetical protein
MNDEEPMRQPIDPPTEEPTFDDLLWELDVTTARAVPPESEATTPVHAPSRKRGTATGAPKEPKPPKRGRFHRPELETRWERLSRNRVVQAVSGTVLLAGTGVLVVTALNR